MTRNRLRSREASYFEKLYTANHDPWDFTGSTYEHHKYATTIETLAGRRFLRGLEVGCSIGVLTKLLANCCDALVAVDVVDQALIQAAARCAVHTHVAFERMRVPEVWPAGRFDLIVFSEVLYFLDRTDIGRIAGLADASLVPGGVLLLVNYTEDIDEPCSGEEAAEVFMKCVSPATVCVNQLRGDSFRIDVLVKRGQDVLVPPGA